MERSAWTSGDEATVASVVDALAPEIWSLARRGFATRDQTRVIVHGIEDPGRAEALVSRVLASVCTPDARAQNAGFVRVRAAALAAAREQLLAHARRTGAETTVEDEADAAPFDDIDRLMTGETSLRQDDPVPSVDAEMKAKADLATAADFVEALAADDAKLIELRFREGRTADEIASTFGIGRAAVRARERRVRRRLRHTLLRSAHAPPGRASQPATHAERGTAPDPGLVIALPDGRSGYEAAEIDALLAGTPLSSALPAVTRERLRRAVCTGMFREEPPTFRVRAAWGLGAAAVALIAFGLMAARVLPHSSDDFPPEPRVVLECKVSCGEGAEAVVKVTAPRGAKNVAVVLVDAAGTTRPLVLDPSARSVTLPFGARRALVALPQTVQLPGGIPLAGQRAVAIFSRTKLSYAAIERASSGRETPQDVLTASFPL